MSRDTTTGSLDASQLEVRLHQLRVVHAPVMPKRAIAVLESRPVAIGREADDEVELVIPDREISRRHAVVEVEDGAWFVRDLGSRNGMAVDGVTVPRAALHDGSVIRLGKSLVLYQELTVSAAEPLKVETSHLLGPSIAMQRVRAEIGLVAPSPLPVLVLGETGVGKELVAEEIHRQSGRSGPLIPVNCASIPAELAESVLFGHAAGSFTGAAKRTTGLFVAAEGGTLFLDEIGEMPASVQAKVLRALENGEVRAVGAHDTTRVDVRVVAATHRDLAARATIEGAFRGDLLARLQGWTLRVPPLRERRDDILALARHFLQDGPSKLSADAAEALLLHPFPYNVRELRQALGAASVRASVAGGELRTEHLPPEMGALVRARAKTAVPSRGVAPQPLEARVPRDAVPTKADLLKVVEAFDGNVARVAEYFGKDRQQVYRWAKRFGMTLDAFRRSGPTS